MEIKRKRQDIIDAIAKIAISTSLIDAKNDSATTNMHKACIHERLDELLNLLDITYTEFSKARKEVM